MSSENLKQRDKAVGVGDAVGDFVVKDQDKNDWCLSDALKKGEVVLCLFPFAFTSVCGTE